MKHLKLMPLFFFLASFALTAIQAQEPVRFQFKGFVKSDFFWDSRQVANARQGHFLLYPLNEELDVQGQDIRATSCFHILPIQSRLLFTVGRKNVLGGDVMAKVEGEFFGTTDDGINNFRLRHAYFKLNWDKSSLLMGQFWHPMFIESNFPATISFNTGVPFIPFARNPQIRYTYRLGQVNASLTALSQLDFSSTGPGGPDISYAVQAGLPALNLRVDILPNATAKTKVSSGISLNTKSIKPANITESGYKDNTKFRTYAATAFLGIKGSKMGVKCQATYGEDMYNLIMIGGYGVHRILNNVTYEKEYVANRTMALWMDLFTQHPKHQLGLLLGYTQNLGASEAFNGDIYGRGLDIGYAYRISPRYSVKLGDIKFATEIEYTVAAYGDADSYGKISDTKEFGNARILLAAFYFFDVNFKK